jgi:hypothetical protein
MELNISNTVATSVGSDIADSRAQKNIADSQSNKANAPEKIDLNYEQPLDRGQLEKPKNLTADFNLEKSLHKAYNLAVDFANKTLLDDNISMSLQNNTDQSKAIVKDIANGKVVHEYDALQVLQMYSSNYNLQGIVIDAYL